MKEIHDLLLWIHIPAGTISLLLFWIPVVVKKGGNLHKKIGRIYYWCMWIVLVTSMLLSITNLAMGHYIASAFLGFLGVLTGYPLWYSYEILNQKGEWSDRYFVIRKTFNWVLFFCSVGMLAGAVMLNFQKDGILMIFFGLLGIPAIKDALMSKPKAMTKEKKLAMHIQGTIISGIAAYTAFFAFGGRTLFIDLLPGYLQILPWVLPTILGVTFIRLMKKKYKTAQ